VRDENETSKEQLDDVPWHEFLRLCRDAWHVERQRLITTRLCVEKQHFRVQSSVKSYRERNTKAKVPLEAADRTVLRFHLSYVIITADEMPTVLVNRLTPESEIQGRRVFWTGRSLHRKNSLRIRFLFSSSLSRQCQTSCSTAKNAACQERSL